MVTCLLLLFAFSASAADRYVANVTNAFVGDVQIESANITNLNVGTNMVIQTAIADPTVTGTNNGIFWASNNTLFWTWTAGGTTTNRVKIAGP